MRKAVFKQDELEIGAQAVHVWIADLPLLETLLGERRAHLSPSELERAGRFRTPADEERYLSTHAIYHLLIAAYVDAPPGEVGYRTGALGAPLPIQSAGGASLCWSLSRRGDYAAFAISTAGPVGVDIESMTAELAAVIAAECLQSSERAAVDRLRDANRTRRIFELWTIKEAVLKRAGLGLALSPRELCIDLGNHDRPFVTVERSHGAELTDVSVRLLDAPKGYVAAVAMDPEISEATRRNLTEPIVRGLMG